MIQYDYSLIRFYADKIRSEVINVGLAIFKENGYVDTFMLQDRAKLRAVSNSLEIEDLNKFGFLVSEASLKLKKEELLFFFSKGRLCLEEMGYFSIEYKEQYINKVSDLMEKLVSPPKTIKQIIPRTPKMITELKQIFNKYPNLISNNLSDIDNHKLILNYPIEDEKGLKADMLLKNGIYHLTETIDFSEVNVVKNLERSALKALTISEAKNKFSSDQLHSFIVYSLNHKDEERYMQQLNLLSSYATEMINLASNEDKSKYVNHILHASGYSL